MKQRPLYNSAPPIDERLIIEKNGITTELIYKFSLKGVGDVKQRLKESAKGYNHGATSTGDRKIESKDITISLNVYAKNEVEHDDLVNKLYGVFSQEKYQLKIGRQDRIFEVEGLKQIKHKYLKGFKQRRSEIDVVLLLADPFRYATQPSEQELIFNQEGLEHELVLENKGNIDTPLTIVFTPETTMPKIKVLHVQTEELLDIRDSLLTNPESLTIDTKQGTVRRGNLNAINSLKGLFLSIMPGSNTYKISCAAGKVKFSYVERWLL